MEEFSKRVREAMAELDELAEQCGGDREKAAVCLLLGITPEELARVDGKAQG